MGKIQYYTLENILKCNAEYNIIFGERSNGKTYASILYCLKEYVKTGYSTAYIRRYEEDVKSDMILQTYQVLQINQEIEKITKNKYNAFKCDKRKLYLCKYDFENDKILSIDNNPCVYALAISSAEHYKSKSFEQIKYIIFDEFITDNLYLFNEFIKFQNLLSTIIRLKDDVKIFMLGNTIDRYCPYFDEMALTNIKNQKPNTIEVYKTEGNLQIACEFVDFDKKYKKSNKYFSFANSKLATITGNGSKWSLGSYPHLIQGYSPFEIVKRFYILFNDEKLQVNLINQSNNVFIFVHKKTNNNYENTPLIFSNIDTNINLTNFNYFFKNIYNCDYKFIKLCLKLISQNKIYFDTNLTGNTFYSFLKYCKHDLQ